MAPGISIINSWRYRGRTFAHSCRRARKLAFCRPARVYTKNKYCEGGADGNALPGVFLATGAGCIFSPSWVSNKMPPGVPAFTVPVRNKSA
jgi:hypothetical protein